MGLIPSANEFEVAGEKLVDHAGEMLDTEWKSLLAALDQLFRTKKVTITVEDREPK